MKIPLDINTSKAVSSLLLEAYVHQIEILSNMDTEYSVRFMNAPPIVQKSMFGFDNHYMAMSYINVGCNKGIIGGESKWVEPTKGNQILEWNFEQQIFKFRRSNSIEDIPKPSVNMKNSAEYNENQGVLFEDFELDSQIANKYHWLINNGLEGGLDIHNYLDKNFFCWVAPFRDHDEKILSNKQVICNDVVSKLRANNPEKTSTYGVEVPNPVFLSKEEKKRIEEEIKDTSINE